MHRHAFGPTPAGMPETLAGTLIPTHGVNAAPEPSQTVARTFQPPTIPASSPAGAPFMAPAGQFSNSNSNSPGSAPLAAPDILGMGIMSGCIGGGPSLTAYEVLQQIGTHSSYIQHATEIGELWCTNSA